MKSFITTMQALASVVIIGAMIVAIPFVGMAILIGIAIAVAYALITEDDDDEDKEG